MTRPRSLRSLHQKGPRRQDQTRATGGLEKTLDALLETPSEDASSGATSAKAAEPSPIETLRQRMQDELVPAVEDFALRYQEKGITVSIDCEGFLEGQGRAVIIDVGFSNHRCKLEGMVTSDGIAFQESTYVSGVAGTVTAGPMLRLRGLTAETLVNYVYDRTISLVHESRRSSSS